MKTTKDGKVKQEKNEIRTGNFFFKIEKGHVKVQDISSLATFRISRSVAAGMWLFAMVEKKAEDTLHIYAASLFSALLTVPDDEFVGRLSEAVGDAMKRHPEWYGVRREKLSDEQQAEVVEGEKEKAEFVEQVKNMKYDEEYSDETQHDV